jgi:hypothetical protein
MVQQNLAIYPAQSVNAAEPMYGKPRVVPELEWVNVAQL